MQATFQKIFYFTYLYYKVLDIFSFERSELPAYPVQLGRECFSLPVSCPKIAGLMIKMISVAIEKMAMLCNHGKRACINHIVFKMLCSTNIVYL